MSLTGRRLTVFSMGLTSGDRQLLLDER